MQVPFRHGKAVASMEVAFVAWSLPWDLPAEAQLRPIIPPVFRQNTSMHVTCDSHGSLCPFHGSEGVSHMEVTVTSMEVSIGFHGSYRKCQITWETAAAEQPADDIVGPCPSLRSCHETIRSIFDPFVAMTSLLLTLSSCRRLPS